MQSQLDELADSLAAAIAQRIKLKVKQQFSSFSLLDDDNGDASAPKRRRNKSPREQTSRTVEDLDETDKKILEILATPMAVEQLSKKIKVSISSVYRRVGKLKDEKRIKLVREGNHVMYTVAPRRGPKKKIKAKRPRATSED